MLLSTDVSATFHPSTIQGSRSLGVGQLNVSGIIISFTVYPSNYGQGFLISYPSKPVIKNGIQELDDKGKPKYFNEVYIADPNTRALVENAVLNAMQNKGVYIQQPQQQNYQQPNNQQYRQPAQQPAANTSFGQPAQQAPNSFANANAPQQGFAAPRSPGTSGSSLVVDDLPF